MLHYRLEFDCEPEDLDVAAEDGRIGDWQEVSDQQLALESAAPTLLHELQECAEVLDALASSAADCDLDDAANIAADCAVAARAAIAKATGAA